MRIEKYKGVYTYKDVIRDPDGMPRIVSDELFDRCQERLKTNKRRPHKDWDYTDYILTDKLFCGKCGAPMVGKSGYGRHGGKYNYYVCTNQIKHACDKKPVRRDDIEEAVLSRTMKLLQDQTVFDFIVDATWNYYLETNNQKKEIERIEKNIRDVEIAIDNLIRSVEQGMPYDLVKSRIEELNGEKIVLAATLADKKVSSQMELTRDHIVFFLEQFRNLNNVDYVFCAVLFKSPIRILVTNLKLNLLSHLSIRVWDKPNRTRKFNGAHLLSLLVALRLLHGDKEIIVLKFWGVPEYHTVRQMVILPNLTGTCFIPIEINVFNVTHYNLLKSFLKFPPGEFFGFSFKNERPVRPISVERTFSITHKI